MAATLTKHTATAIKKSRWEGVEAWKDGELSARIFYNAMGGYSIGFYNGDMLTSQITAPIRSVAAAYSRLPKAQIVQKGE